MKGLSLDQVMPFHGRLVLLVLQLASLSLVSSQNPKGYYLIDCGSSSNASIGNRLFLADDVSSQNFLKTSETVLVSTHTGSDLPTFDAKLYRTARVFPDTAQYTFLVPNPGWYLVRLYFFPFVDQNRNLSAFRFSVSAQNYTLLSDFRIENGPAMKEYALDVSSDALVVIFTPSFGSAAFINALEVIPLPANLIPASIMAVGSHERSGKFGHRAIETVMRVNMGNESVSPENDALSRSWVPDEPFLAAVQTRFVSRIEKVRYGNDSVASRKVYGTATTLDAGTHVVYANLSWKFDVSPGFEYLVRLHFCDILNSSSVERSFRVYVNTWFVSDYDDVTRHSSDVVGVPFFVDVVAKSNEGASLTVSVGPRSVDDIEWVAFLNGLEIMKLPDSEGRFEALNSLSPVRKSRRRTVVLACLVAGAFVVAVASVLFVLVYRRRRRKLALVAHSKADLVPGNATAAFSGAEAAYSIPLWLIKEATNDFNENLVIGVGGFGKVYRGVLRDNRAVAIKRGFISRSNQGLSEFKTEIEMLSKFRHRHLVSLIGYCDERGEMIIVYEQVANGTLKEHLYGSDFPSLSWRQRVQICIGSARGLHYLHTGTAKAIIHRDVKSANILIDENFLAKVADFGLSKAGPEIDKTHVSTAVKGSFGYLDPEYLIMQQLTEKSDVYSFGVVMLEVLCGRAVIDPSLSRENVSLIEWAMKYQRTGRIGEVLDPCLAGQVSTESLRKFGDLAEKCLAERGVLRPTMGDVLWNLECALQLQGAEPSSPAPRSDDDDDQSETSLLDTSISLGDLNGISMSTVFAQMVKEEKIAG